MKLFSSWLVFVGSAATVSGRAPPPNKKFTQRHSEIIDAVAWEEPNAAEKMANQMFEKNGLEGLAPSTIQRYLKQARERTAKSHQAPAESVEDGSLQSLSEYDEVAAEDDFAEDGSIKSTSRDEHVLVGRSKKFTPAHESIMRDVFALNEDFVDTKKEFFELSSKEFEKNRLDPVSLRTFGYHFDAAGLSSGYRKTGRKSDKAKKGFPAAIFQHRLLANVERGGEEEDKTTRMRNTSTNSVGRKRERKSAEKKRTRKVSRKNFWKIYTEEEEKLFAVIDAMLPSLWDLDT